MKHLYIVTFFVFCFGIQLAAAEKTSERITPRWLRETPIPSNNTFEYVLQTAFASTMNAAREGCFASLVRDSGHSNGFISRLNQESVTDYNARIDSTSQYEMFRYKMDIAPINETPMYVKEIAEYYTLDKGIYKVTRLYQKSSGIEKPSFDQVELSTKYGMLPVAYSIVPGVGQFVKGDILKGSLFLGSISLSLAGYAVCHSVSNSYHNRAAMSHEASVIRDCNKYSSNYSVASYVCLGLGSILYILNLVDAGIAPGASRVVATGNSVKIKF